MKILQLVTRSEPGGAQTIVRTLSEALTEKGHEIMVASGPEGSGEAWKQMSGKVEIAVLPHLRRRVSFFDEFKAMAEISSLYRSFRPDCVNLHTSKAGLLGRITPGISRKRLIYTMHGFDQLRVANRRFFAADKILRRLGGAVVAVSSQDEASMKDEGYTPILIPNGTVDTRLKPVPHDEISARLAALKAKGLPLVITVARDARPKRIDLVRDLAVRFRGRVSIAWIGGDSCRDDAKSAREDDLVCLGTVPDAASYLPLADIFLLASDHEGMPVSLVEAMSAGLPGLASCVGGVSELLGGGCGIAVSNSVEAFSDGLARLLASESLRREMGHAARMAWETRYSVDRMAEAYEALYRRCSGAEG